jgi:MEMO1 family protein
VSIRPPAVAGRFYPDDPERLQQMVNGFLETAVPATITAPQAIIAPHAGYPYSGPIAGSAYRALLGDNRPIRRAVLIGPAHTMALEGLATVSTTAWATPLGLVFVDQEGVEAIRPLPQVQILDAAHAQEHGLEVQLPFLQTIYSELAIVPLVVGRATGREVAELLARLGSDPQTIIVISSDLSHYYDYKTAQQLDRQTAAAIVALQPEKIVQGSACGYLAIRGLLHWARENGLTAATADLRNSGDTAGDKGRVVGYGAFLFGLNITSGR